MIYNLFNQLSSGARALYSRAILKSVTADQFNSTESPVSTTALADAICRVYDVRRGLPDAHDPMHQLVQHKTPISGPELGAREFLID